MKLPLQCPWCSAQQIVDLNAITPDDEFACASSGCGFRKPFGVPITQLHGAVRAALKTGLPPEDLAQLLVVYYRDWIPRRPLN